MTNSREMTGHSNTLKMDESEDRDSRIGDGMDVTITGNNGSVLQTKDSWGTIDSSLMPDVSFKDRMLDEELVDNEDMEKDGSSWRQSKTRTEPSIGESVMKVQQVDEVMYDPLDEVVVYDCCPASYYQICPCCSGDGDSPLWYEWHKHRMQISRLIEDKYFETVVLALILLSSFVMTLEDVWFDTRPLLVDALFYLDRILTVVFFLETCLKLFAMGFVVYFTNAWCWLDFVIVGVSIINFVASLLGAANIPIFKTMRTLRALRPLRAMAKMEGMKVVVNALIGALPSIFNVLLVCLIFWLIFAIFGVNLYKGKFSECIDTETGQRFNKEIVPNKTVCLSFETGLWTVAR